MNSEKLNPLPVLPVLREEYCSQEFADEAIAYLEQSFADRLLLLRDEEQVTRLNNYYKRLSSAVEPILPGRAPVGIQLPTSQLGFVDLANELSRRLRYAYGLPSVRKQGISLASSLNGPFPILESISISDETRNAGFDQRTIDALLSESYRNRPDLWFNLSEACRSNVLIYSVTGEFEKHLGDTAVELGLRLPEAHFIPLSYCMSEAIKRLRKICKIGEMEILKLCEPHNHTEH